MLLNRRGVRWPDRQGMLLWLIPLFGLLLIGGMWIFVFQQMGQERRTTLHQAAVQAQNLARAYAAQAERAIEEIDLDTKLLEYEYERDPANFDLTKAISKGLVTTDRRVLYTLSDEHGNISATSMSTLSRVNIADRDYFINQSQDNKGELYIGRPVLGRISHQWSIPVSRRLNKPDGSFAGALIVAIDPALFTEFYDTAELGERGELALIGFDGALRARRAGQLDLRGERADETPLLELARTYLQGTTELTSSLDGVRRIVGYRVPAQLPLVASVGLAKDDLLAPSVGREMAFYAAASAISMLILIVFLLLTLRAYKWHRSALEAKEALAVYQAASNASLDAFYLLRPIRNEAGQIIDFEFVDLNDNGAKLVSKAKTAVVGRTFNELPPFPSMKGLLDKMAQVEQTQHPVEEEFAVDTAILQGKWLHSTVVPVGDGVALTLHDVTDSKLIHDEVRDSHAFLKEIMDYIPIAIYVKSARGDQFGRFVLWNKASEQMFGVKAEDCLGKTAQEVFPPAIAHGFVEQDRAVIAKATREDIAEEAVSLPGSERRYLNKIKAPIFDAQHLPEYILCIAEDVTERKRGADRLRLASKVFESSAEGIVLSDADDCIIMVNPAFSLLTGYSADEVLRAEANDFEFDSLPGTEYLLIWKDVIERGSWSGETSRRRKDGSQFACWLNIKSVKDNANRIVNYVRVFSDISELKESQRQLERLANYDSLTELPNRNLFVDQLGLAIQRANRKHHHIALMFIDLDNFKDVNDTLGHDVGDLLLRQAAARIKGCLRAADIVCRLGGDEFTVIMEDAAIPTEARQVGQRIVKAFAEPFTLNGGKILGSVSIGISVYPADGADVNTLLKNADSAMYIAKQQGKNGIRFFSENSGEPPEAGELALQSTAAR